MDEPKAGQTAPGTAAAASAGMPPELDRRQLILALAGVLLCILVAALDQTIVGTALPRIIATLHGLDRYTWVVTAYVLATATMAAPKVRPITRPAPMWAPRPSARFPTQARRTPKAAYSRLR